MRERERLKKLVFKLFGTEHMDLIQSLSHVRLYAPMDYRTPGLAVHHQYPELTQTHVHRVGNAIQPSQSLSAPSPPAFNLSQHQGFSPMRQFFTSGGQCIGVSASASVLLMNSQD